MYKSQSSTDTPRVKQPKSRNSETRKEQNRIASRAYREKRKQKLALLDQILNTENGESPSSSSEPDEVQGSLSVTHSRHTSRSPVPTPQSVPTGTTLWPSPSQTLASNGTFGEEALEDLWINDFDRGGDLFGANRDFVAAFHPVSLGSAAQYPQTLPSMPSMSSLSSMPLDPLLPGSHVAHYSDRAPRSAPGAGHGTPLLYDDRSFGSSSGSRMANALESFSRLSGGEQQQMLDIIYKRTGMAPGMGTDHAWDIHGGYPMTPPADHLMSSARDNSRSPNPRRRR